jgi:hypothetical protein
MKTRSHFHELAALPPFLSRHPHCRDDRKLRVFAVVARNWRPAHSVEIKNPEKVAGG